VKKIIILLFVLICANSWLQSTIFHIKQDGSGNFTTIQEGIDASADSDTVLVSTGTFYENLDFNGKNIMLCSQELTTGNSQFISSTIIDGQYLDSCIRIHNGETNAHVRGFTIQHGYGTQFWSRDGGGILVHDYSTVYITNCIIKHNKATLGAGLYARHGFLNVSGVKIIENYGILGGGIFTDDESTLSFDSENLCSIYNNYASRGSDIFSQDSDYINIIVDTFTVYEPSRFFIEYLGTTTLSIDIQHNWMELEPHDLYVATDGNDDNSGLSVDDPLKTISWAVHKIQADEDNPRTIHVESGLYSHADNQQIYPIGCKEYVSIIGEDMDNTVLFNNFLQTAINGKNVEGAVEFSNFTIQNDPSINSGCIIFLNDMETVKLTNIKICNNANIKYIFTDGNELSKYDNLIITDNVPEESNAVLYLRGAGYLKNSIISNNTNNSTYPNSCVVALSISARGDESEFNAENCLISNNYTDNNHAWTRVLNVTNWNGNEPTIRFNNCLINDNYCGSNHIFGIFNYNGLTEINNCTIANNTSEAYTLYNYGDLNLTNTIMYNPDNGIEIFMEDDTLNGNRYTLNVDNCNIWGGLEGGIYNQNDINNINWNEGNINEIPDFLGYGNDPYQLSELSPCIDAGTPDTTGLFLPPWDLLNNERVWDGDGNGTEIIDMGCYEYGAEPYVEISNNQLPVTNIQMTNYPNPFNPSTTIAFNLVVSGEVKVEIFNIKGQKVKTLMECSTSAGSFELIWNGRNNAGRRVASGEYIAMLKVNGMILVERKMLLLK
jgi:FlgD Ig-like domain